MHTNEDGVPGSLYKRTILYTLVKIFSTICMNILTVHF